jgi:hypothetical protein
MTGPLVTATPCSWRQQPRPRYPVNGSHSRTPRPSGCSRGWMPPSRPTTRTCSDTMRGPGTPGLQDPRKGPNARSRSQPAIRGLRPKARRASTSTPALEPDTLAFQDASASSVGKGRSCLGDREGSTPSHAPTGRMRRGRVGIYDPVGNRSTPRTLALRRATPPRRARRTSAGSCVRRRRTDRLGRHARGRHGRNRIVRLDPSARRAARSKGSCSIRHDGRRYRFPASPDGRTGGRSAHAQRAAGRSRLHPYWTRAERIAANQVTRLRPPPARVLGPLSYRRHATGVSWRSWTGYRRTDTGRVGDAVRLGIRDGRGQRKPQLGVLVWHSPRTSPARGSTTTASAASGSGRQRHGALRVRRWHGRHPATRRGTGATPPTRTTHRWSREAGTAASSSSTRSAPGASRSSTRWNCRK